MDWAPRLLAPKGTITGAFGHWRMERPATLYAAVQSSGAALSAVMDGTGALAPALTAGAPSFAVVIPLTGGLVNEAFVPGGILLGMTVGGQGQVTGTVTPGSALVAPGQRDDVVWRAGLPLRVLRPTTNTTTGSASFWRMERMADTLQAGPPPTPPPETFWRVGRPLVVARPK